MKLQVTAVFANVPEAQFQRLADERCARLAKLTFAELNTHPIEAETIKLGGRTGSLTTHVEHRPDGSLRVVVHGLLRFKRIPFLNNVAVQGFYKHPDGSVSAIPDDEANELDERLPDKGLKLTVRVD